MRLSILALLVTVTACDSTPQEALESSTGLFNCGPVTVDGKKFVVCRSWVQGGYSVAIAPFEACR
jgi:hypothetical protein